ncbi:MAG: hypothetical protein H7840_01890 [Alphaproteobacteria bacterium]
MKRSHNGNLARRNPGMVLVTIMVVSLACMMVVSVLINQVAVIEARAVEQLLWDSRFYWAMDGHTSLVLSQGANKLSTGQLCGGVCTSEATRVTNINTIAGNSGSVTWSYGTDTTKQFITTTSGSGCGAAATVDNSGNCGAVDYTPPSSNIGTLLFGTRVADWTNGAGSFIKDEVFGASTLAAMDKVINPLLTYFCISSTSACGIPPNDPTLTPEPNPSRIYITKVTRPAL